jgi:hypothetical protein
MIDEREINNRKIQEMDPTTAYESITKVMTDIYKDALKENNMWVRAGFCLIMAQKATAEGNQVKWDLVTELVLSPRKNVYDYNILPEKIESLEELEDINSAIQMASLNIGPWQSHKCKDCKDEFYMTINEVDFFQSKGLHIPKRCKDCRDKRRNS